MLTDPVIFGLYDSKGLLEPLTVDLRPCFPVALQESEHDRRAIELFAGRKERGVLDGGRKIRRLGCACFDEPVGFIAGDKIVGCEVEGLPQLLALDTGETQVHLPRISEGVSTRGWDDRMLDRRCGRNPESRIGGFAPWPELRQATGDWIKDLHDFKVGLVVHMKTEGELPLRAGDAHAYRDRILGGCFLEWAVPLQSHRVSIDPRG